MILDFLQVLISIPFSRGVAINITILINPLRIQNELGIRRVLLLWPIWLILLCLILVALLQFDELIETGTCTSYLIQRLLLEISFIACEVVTVDFGCFLEALKRRIVIAPQKLLVFHVSVRIGACITTDSWANFIFLSFIAKLWLSASS